MSHTPEPAPLLEARALSVGFPDGSWAVRELSFCLAPRRTLGVVGESGSGKSMTALAIAGLTPRPAHISGELRYKGKDLLALDAADRRRYRGREIAMVFQEPATSLNPVLSIGAQITEAVRAHRDLGRRQSRGVAHDLLAEVGLPDPARQLRCFPHELSGGQRQRCLIAIALACRPTLLLADEPTTALDVSVQAQVLDLLSRLIREHDMTMIFISHDLRVIAEIADEVLVMRDGRSVELAEVTRLFHYPRDPYTRRLLAQLPREKDHG